VGSGGAVVPAGLAGSLARELGRRLEEGLRVRVAAGWVVHSRPESAATVVRRGLERARSGDPDSPEGFFFSERFGPGCPGVW
jgi:hypothetical protein